jgi:hypothetical protein
MTTRLTHFAGVRMNGDRLADRIGAGGLQSPHAFDLDYANTTDTTNAQIFMIT